MNKYRIKYRYWRRSFFFPIKIHGKNDFSFRNGFWGDIFIWNNKGLKIRIKNPGVVVLNGKEIAKYDYFIKENWIYQQAVSIEIEGSEQKLLAVKKTNNEGFEIIVKDNEKLICKSIIMPAPFDFGAEIVIEIYSEKLVEIILATILLLSEPVDGFSGG